MSEEQEPIRVKFYEDELVEWSDCIPDGEYILSAPAPHPVAPLGERTLSDESVLKVLDTYAKRIKELESAAVNPGEIAYQLTKRLVIDMPTARAAVDAALATPTEAPAITVEAEPAQHPPWCSGGCCADDAAHPKPAAQSDVELNAARYVGLRDGGFIPAPVQVAHMVYDNPKTIDEAVDAALAISPLVARPYPPATQAGSDHLSEGIRVIDALIVKSDCSLDRNQEFYDAGRWKAKSHHLATTQAQPVGEPVVVIGRDFQLLWASPAPIADIVKRHGLTVGSCLYALRGTEGKAT